MLYAPCFTLAELDCISAHPLRPHFFAPARLQQAGLRYQQNYQFSIYLEMTSANL